VRYLVEGLAHCGAWPHQPRNALGRGETTSEFIFRSDVDNWTEHPINAKSPSRCRGSEAFCLFARGSNPVSWHAADDCPPPPP